MAALKSRKLHGPQDVGGLFTDMVRRGYTDGLPVIPPTERAVRAMIDYVGLASDERIVLIAPRQGAATVEKLAINAVMAGCLPEYFPVVIAAVKAITQPQFNLLGVQATTAAASPVLIINGPIRNAIDINCRRGCMGPGFRANATIGRAVRLILLNIGGGKPGEVDKANHGMPGKFTFCFGELEEETPWQPLHVDHGYESEQSTVTAVAGLGTQPLHATFRTPESVIHMVADGMACYGNGYLRGTGNPVVVFTPGFGRMFAEHGWTKKRVQEELFERTKIPLSRLPQERQLANPVYSDWERSRSIQLCREPDDILIVIAGGPEAYQVTYISVFPSSLMAISRIDPAPAR